VNYSYEAPSWSPDGKVIATSVGISVTSVQGPKKGYALVLVPVAGGKPLTLPFPDDIHATLPTGGAHWLPDQSGLLVSSRGQIWLQPFLQGSPQRITNDLNRYDALATTADGKRFSAMQTQSSNTILVGPAADPDRATPIGAAQSDGWGLAWTLDGKILSTDGNPNSSESNSQFWLSSPDRQDRVAAFRIEGDLWGHFRCAVEAMSSSWAVNQVDRLRCGARTSLAGTLCG
jgi:hypothetical protein